MNPTDQDPFITLFRAVCWKCFNTVLQNPLSEPESRHLGNEIFEKTGLVIGPKSIRNYSLYATGKAAGKTENPSVATLDTFARYVLNGAYTDETARKKNESHFPYWFRFKSSLADEQVLVNSAPPKRSAPATPTVPATTGARGARRMMPLIFALGFIGVSLLLWYLSSRKPGLARSFTDDFGNVSADSLAAKGWMLQGNDEKAWARRGEKPGALTLITLPGDNWADPAGHQGIRNLLVRPITAECFSTEVHIDDFFPTHNWQQAGILLMEEGPGKGRSLRISIAYNSYFGGYARPPEIYLQSIASTAEDPGKPEEIVHLPLFTVAAGERELVKNNLQHSAIRVEKTGNHYRILYAAGPVANFAFKEALSKDIAFKPTYLGLFALEGFVADTDYLPAAFSWFALKPEKCK